MEKISHLYRLSFTTGLLNWQRTLQRFYGGMPSESKDGGVAITFDDAYIDEWYSLRELMASYGAKVTFFVSHVDLLTAAAIDKLKILRDDGHEIGFHGLRHLNAVKFVENHSIDDYLSSEILPGIDVMSGHGFFPLNFSYPYGAHTSHIDAALLKLFKHVRGTSFTNSTRRMPELSNIYCKYNDSVIYGAGIDKVYQNSIEEIQEGLRRAMKKKETLILYAHKPATRGEDYSFTPEKMEAILKYASEIGAKFYRTKDL